MDQDGIESLLLQNGKEDEFVAISDAKHVHKEDKSSEARAICKAIFRLFNDGEVAQQVGVRETELAIVQDKTGKF